MHWDIYWSLAIEEQFYALFPWSLKLELVRNNISWALIALIMIAPVGRFICTRLFPVEFVAMNSFCALDLMALGVLLHLLILKYGDAAKHRLAMCHLFCLLGGFCVLYVVTSDRPGAFGIYGPSVLGLGLLVFLFFGLQIKWIQQLPRFLAMGGELSYGAYLLHPLALLALYPVLSHRAFIIDYPLYFFTVMTLAWCSFRFLELPLNFQIKRWLLHNEN